MMLLSSTLIIWQWLLPIVDGFMWVHLFRYCVRLTDSYVTMAANAHALPNTCNLVHLLLCITLCVSCIFILKVYLFIFAEWYSEHGATDAAQCDTF